MNEESQASHCPTHQCPQLPVFFDDSRETPQARYVLYMREFPTIGDPQLQCKKISQRRQTEEATDCRGCVAILARCGGVDGGMMKIPTI